METGDSVRGLIRRHNAVHGRALEGREAEIQRRIAEKEKPADTKSSAATTHGDDHVFAPNV